MVNITHKNHSLRVAVAQATVRVSDPATINAIQERKVPKGDVFEFSRASGLLAVKKTSDVIPDCHPLPVEYTAITSTVKDLNVFINVEVHTIYKTGVEVEAMHGAAVAALTMYDMLKPIDKGVVIAEIRLVSKRGGKSDHKQQDPDSLKAAVVVCSDAVSKGQKEDTAGMRTEEKLMAHQVHVTAREVIPDDADRIREKVTMYKAQSCDLLVFVGGTGLSPRDITPDTIKPLLDREIPGIMEVARQYGQQRMPYAMLSRGICGFIGDMLVITLPGSPKGATETLDALLPHLLHVFRMAQGQRHD
jgi:cyclic pyranopterin monophosphate synthase